MTPHVAADNGAGICTACPRPVTTYDGKLQHRRGRPVGAPGRLIPLPPRAKCASCKRAYGRKLLQFTLMANLDGMNAARRPAGRTRLCEECWRRLVA